jgi:hypothetical protein
MEENMKRSLFVVFVLVLLSGSLSAQEVKTALGTFTLNGTMVTGIVTEMTQQEGHQNDGNWGKIEVRNPDWTENRFELGLSYAFGNYGAYVSLKTPGPVNNFWEPDPIDIGHAFVYATFLDEKIKVSFGKLYEQLFLWPGTQVWKTRLIGNNFNFSGEWETSLRMEFKPVENLNVGFQLFFVDETAKLAEDQKGFAKSDWWKEIGIGAQYEVPDLFAVQSGIRFDSKIDGKSNRESSTVQSYVDEYYGSSNYVGMLSPALASMLGFNVAKYKHMDEIYEEDPQEGMIALPFDGGAYAYVGFQLNMIKDLPIAGRAGFFNIGAFDHFGFSYMLETVTYKGIKDLDLTFTMTQQFHGNDVFIDELKNSPLLTFDPEVKYNLPINNLSVTLGGSFGLCADVLEYQYSIKPKVAYALGFGLGSVELYYNFEHKDFVESAGVKDVSYHKIGFGVWWMF